MLIATSALAGSVTQPGETVGLAAGAPLPQGLYFVNTGDWGNRSGVDTSLGVDIPVLAWSNSMDDLRRQGTVPDSGSRGRGRCPPCDLPPRCLQSAGLGPIGVGPRKQLGIQLSARCLLGVDSEVAWSSTSLNQRFALSYTGNQLNLTANVIWGTHFDHVTGSPQLYAVPGALRIERLQSRLLECRSDGQQEVR